MNLVDYKKKSRCLFLIKLSSSGIFHLRFILRNFRIISLASSRRSGPSDLEIDSRRIVSSLISSCSFSNPSDLEKRHLFPHLGHSRRSASPQAGHPALQRYLKSVYSDLKPHLVHVKSISQAPYFHDAIVISHD